jgi:hypothetical protein
MLHQIGQELEWLRGQPDLFTAAAEKTAFEVQGEVAKTV